MSRYLPDPAVPLAPWCSEVVEAVRSAGCGLYAVVYPNASRWQVTMLRGLDVDVVEGFGVDGAWPQAVEAALAVRGYITVAALPGQTWKELPGGGQGSALLSEA